MNDDAWSAARRRQRFLPAAAAVSFALLILLLCGYLGRVGIMVYRNNPGTVPSYSTIVIMADRGRVIWLRDTAAYPMPGARPPNGMHIHGLFEIFPPRPPDFRRSIWEFDAHYLTGTSTFILACPIWCIAVFCLIAPTAWLLQKKRRHEEREGFPLEGETLITEPVRQS